MKSRNRLYTYDQSIFNKVVNAMKWKREVRIIILKTSNKQK